MNKRGFTLIELVIVIVLLGILSAVALPKFFDVSTDARRSANQATVGALNVAVASAIAKARVPGYLVAGAGVATPGNSEIATPYMVTLDTGTLGLYNFIGFASNSTGTLIPVGGGKQSGTVSNNIVTPTSFAALATGGTAYADMTGTTAGAATGAGCNNLFNMLVGDSNVMTGLPTVTTTTYQTIIASPYNAAAFTTINGQTATSFNIGAITNGQMASATITTKAVPGTSGACLYLMNASSTSTPKFYIIYDASKGVFYPAEGTL